MGPTKALVRWLQNRSLLPDPLRCATCNRDMNLVKRGEQHLDTYQW